MLNVEECQMAKAMQVYDQEKNNKSILPPVKLNEEIERAHRVYVLVQTKPNLPADNASVEVEVFPQAMPSQHLGHRPDPLTICRFSSATAWWYARYDAAPREGPSNVVQIIASKGSRRAWWAQ